MKRHLTEFWRRGIVSFGFGPVVLAVLYWILRQQGIVQMLTVEQVCIGIFSVSALAFIAGGMNFVYQIEQLPLMVAILIHGSVLYLSYLVTYLLNSWLERGTAPILVFTGIFVFGYFTIWAIIYFVIHKHTQKLNKMLSQKRKFPEETA